MSDTQVSSTFGSIRRRVDLDGFAVYETAHAPLQSIPRHVHDYAAWVFLLRGSFEENVERRRLRCLPGHILLRPPGEPHVNLYGRSGARCLIVALAHGRFRRLQELSSMFEHTVSLDQGNLSALARRIYGEFEIGDLSSALAMEGLLLEFFGEAARQFSREPGAQMPPGWLKVLKEKLHADFRGKLSVAALAEDVDMHPVHVARVFRRHHGCSLGEYVRRLRIEAACRDLTDADTPLAQIALQAGFSAQSHFCAAFKRVVGITPTEYRDALRTRSRQ